MEVINMTIDKRPSGSYRIRQYCNGKNYSVTIDHKPTLKEAEQLIQEVIRKSGHVVANDKSVTIAQAGKDYIALKKNALSPSTILGYNKLYRLLPEWFSSMKVRDIENYHIQKFLNEYMVNRSYKTVKNMLGFITPIIHLYNPSIHIDVTLPQKVNKLDDYIPTDNDVKRIMEYATDTIYEIPLILATFGLRRSEICALQSTDLNGAILTINKAYVMDENRQWVVKTTKTTSSARKIALPANIVDRINAKGIEYNGYPDSINEFLTKALDFLEIPHFSLHKFRHYFATKMSTILPEADVLRLGGWEKSNNSVMKAVYRHSNYDRDVEMQNKAANAMMDLF